MSAWLLAASLCLRASAAVIETARPSEVTRPETTAAGTSVSPVRALPGASVMAAPLTPAAVSAPGAGLAPAVGGLVSPTASAVPSASPDSRETSSSLPRRFAETRDRERASAPSAAALDRRFWDQAAEHPDLSDRPAETAGARRADLPRASAVAFAAENLRDAVASPALAKPSPFASVVAGHASPDGLSARYPSAQVPAPVSHFARLAMKVSGLVVKIEEAVLRVFSTPVSRAEPSTLRATARAAAESERPPVTSTQWLERADFLETFRISEITAAAATGGVAAPAGNRELHPPVGAAFLGSVRGARPRVESARTVAPAEFARRRSFPLYWALALFVPAALLLLSEY